jgi:hypothetical protein
MRLRSEFKRVLVLCANDEDCRCRGTRGRLEEMKMSVDVGTKDAVVDLILQQEAMTMKTCMIDGMIIAASLFITSKHYDLNRAMVDAYWRDRTSWAQHHVT